MRPKFFVVTLVSLLLGCTKYYGMEACVIANGSNDRDCEVVAKFKDMKDCQYYKLLYKSRINYDELKQTGRTNIILENYSSFGESELTCK